MKPDESFSFAGLIKPGTAHRHVLERQLQVQQARERERKPPEWRYAGESDYLLRHGQWFTGRALPDVYDDTVGAMTHCHINSLEACEAHPELRYFTGFYLVAKEVGVHSWCVAPDGGVVETTYPTKGVEPGAITVTMPGSPDGVPYLGPEHWSYFGLEFKASFVRALIAEYGLYLPVLDPICPFHETAMRTRYSVDGWPTT